MSSLNVEWAIAELDRFIVTAKPGTKASEASPMAQAAVVEKIFNHVFPHWQDALNASSGYDPWFAHRSVAIRARELLRRRRELEENLGDDAPKISTKNLHPWTWSGASSLWQSGHYLEAVRTACLKVNAETQRKLDRRDLNESDLFNQAFSTDKPKPGAARLRRMPDDGSKTYKSVQRGAMAFAEGIFAGIRNPLSHEADQEIGEQVALEYLAALSVLARWVDESMVERAEETR